MRKYLLIAPVIFVLIIGFTVFYMSNYGLKTNKFRCQDLSNVPNKMTPERRPQTDLFF